MEGQWHERVNVQESTWTLEDGDKLILSLEKGTETIWKTVLQGDQEIDTSKVDNSKRIDQFDDETQGALRKIVYEQNRKMAGLPTSEEENQMETLKKAWDAEGSPFKGQPFDPSKINFSGGGAGNMFSP